MRQHNGRGQTTRNRAHPYVRRFECDVASDAGFTLLELLVVLGIIVLIATIAAPQVMRYLGDARTETAKAQISAISTALELYALDNGGFPPERVGLNALVQAPQGQPRWRGPYLKRADGLRDPWGQPYRYKFPGAGGQPQVYTLGRDNAQGGTGENLDVSS
ncbi:MAG: type II secretion system major pseudopilin GspG [Hyphomicrobium sp.]|nr:type II secretion system major pseudopilin GspG [Hyphomicrobium sp.]